MTTRNFKATIVLVVLPLPLLAVWVQAQPACSVSSGVQTAALVELYTSEGCSSCPPADRALSALQASAAAGLVVPLALHVTYWDQIGWRDPFGQGRFDVRQRALLDEQGLRTAYTPQFFLAGSELRNWPARMGSAIAAINAKRAPVSLTLDSQPTATGMVIDVHASTVAGSARPASGALYLALTENALASKVLRGENGGSTLHHDAAARLLVGPVPLVAGSARLHQAVTIPEGWRRSQLQAVAFVQEQSGPAILQALSTAACPARGL